MQVVAKIAAQHANAVDQEARFPREAIDALRHQGLLGIMVPRELGGEAATISNIAEQYFVVDRSAYVPRVGSDSLSVQLHLLQPDVLTTGLIPGLTELGPVYLEGSLVAKRNYFNLLIQAPRIVYRDWDVDSLNVRSFAGDSAALFVLTTPLVFT